MAITTKQGYLREKGTSGQNEVRQAPKTLASLVYDAARNGQSLQTSLADLIEYYVLGASKFSTLTNYSVGDKVFYDRGLWKFTQNHPAGAWTGTDVQTATVTGEDLELRAQLLNGLFTPLTATTLLSWLNQGNLTVDDTQVTDVFFAGGNESIDSGVQAVLKSIVAKTNFFASKLISSGKNLLRLTTNKGIATAVGTGFYFPVPAMAYGQIGTAAEPNGVLFTDKDGNNLTPTVRFSTTIPTAITDGDACAYTDATDGQGNTFRFYTTSQAGYLIVSGITLEETCARVAWSGGSDFPYNQFVSPTAEDDAGSVIDLTSAIHALHSFDEMLTIGTSADRLLKYNDEQVQWRRECDRVQPTWTNTLQEDGETYLHTTTINTMKPDGAARFSSNNQILSVNGNETSYTDTNETAITDTVEFELDNVVTGLVSLETAMNAEDYGLMVLLGAIGEAYTTVTYGQNIPDSLRALVSAKMSIQMRIIAEALVQLYHENQGLKALINNPTRCINAEEYRSCGFPMMLSAAGAPNASVVPNEWNEATMGVWTGVPMVPGQEYFNTQNNKWYKAKMPITGAVDDWLLLN